MAKRRSTFAVIASENIVSKKRVQPREQSLGGEDTMGFRNSHVPRTVANRLAVYVFKLFPKGGGTYDMSTLQRRMRGTVSTFDLDNAGGGEFDVQSCCNMSRS